MLLCVCTGAWAQAVDEAIGDVLRSVELNNQSLAAQRNLTDARTLEARTGNGLENPEVEFEYKWGDPSSLGKAGEISVSQPFDFPTSYIYRARIARDLAAQYGYEYAAVRQQLLLDAQSLCLEIIALRQQNAILKQAYENAVRISEIMARREATGDANILEANKARFELAAAKNAYDLNVIELTSAEKRLVNLNGGQPLEFAAETFPQQPQLVPKEEILRRYEELSPELLALISGVDAAQNDIRLSRSMSMPRFSAGYKHEYARGVNERFNGVMIGMSIPMFGNRNNVKRAKTQAIYAESQYHAALLDMRSGLDELYAKADLLAASMNDYRRITDGARSVELLNKAIEAGQISITDYFAELSPVYDAAMAMTQTERDLHLVCARIMMIDL